MEHRERNREHAIGRQSRHRVAVLAAAAGAALILVLLVLPVVVLLARGGASGMRELATDRELTSAIGLTIACASAATLVAVLLGTPLAWFLARRSSTPLQAVGALLELPLLLPHPVAGIALLLTFGRASSAGAALAAIGLSIVGSPLGITLAMLFVAAPLYLSAAREAIARVDPRYEQVARTLGDSQSRAAWRITRPLAQRGLLAAAVVMWARSASEFGAIVILTYNPKVASVLSYDRFTASGLDAALPVAAVLVLLAIVPLVALRSLRGTRALDETR